METNEMINDVSEQVTDLAVTTNGNGTLKKVGIGFGLVALGGLLAEGGRRLIRRIKARKAAKAKKPAEQEIDPNEISVDELKIDE